MFASSIEERKYDVWYSLPQHDDGDTHEYLQSLGSPYAVRRPSQGRSDRSLRGPERCLIRGKGAVRRCLLRAGSGAAGAGRARGKARTAATPRPGKPGGSELHWPGRATHSPVPGPALRQFMDAPHGKVPTRDRSFPKRASNQGSKPPYPRTRPCARLCAYPRFVSGGADSRTAITNLRRRPPVSRPRSLGTGICVLPECGDDVDTTRVSRQAACRQEGACARIAGQWQLGAKEAPTFQETREQIGRSVPVPHPERCGIRVSGAGYSPPPN